MLNSLKGASQTRLPKLGGETIQYHAYSIMHLAFHSWGQETWARIYLAALAWLAYKMRHTISTIAFILILMLISCQNQIFLRGCYLWASRLFCFWKNPLTTEYITQYHQMTDCIDCMTGYTGNSQSSLDWNSIVPAISSELGAGSTGDDDWFGWMKEKKAHDRLENAFQQDELVWEAGAMPYLKWQS